LVAIASIFVAGSVTGAREQTAAAPAAEVRGLWVQRTSLVSPQAVAAVVTTAKDAGFNALFVQVRGRGEAFYRSDLEPRASDLDGQSPAFDPLAMMIDRARANGLAVHAWVNVNLVASGATLPRSKAHIAWRHPEWLMVPRELASRLGATNARSPGYIGTLGRWVRAHAATVEGLYLSPLSIGAQDHTIAVVTELLARYALDGLHLDYIRFPGPEFDYSPAALAEFRTAQLAVTSPGDRERFDRAAKVDSAAWTSARPNAWAAFRRDRVTALVSRLRAAARAARPGLVVTAAVVPSAAAARDQKFQDWPAWVAAGHLDALCPMLYATELDQFVADATAVTASARTTPIWAGIGAWRLPAAQTAEHVRAARRAGAAGVVVFSYDSFSGLGGAAAYLAALRPVLLETAAGGPSGR
jgi:uncharacterized lipoprotein YddW (UPF0748 family)